MAGDRGVSSRKPGTVITRRRGHDRGEFAMPLTWWQVLLAGVIATVSMHVLTAIAIRLGLLAPSSPNVVGRWFASVAHAHPFHKDIARAAPRSHELAIALPVHYAIGLFLTALFILIADRIGWQARSLSPAMAFGV